MEHFPLIDRIHTDVLEAKYGPIKAKVVQHNSKIREAHLTDNKEISRTYAITFFDKAWGAQIKTINKKIKEGKPIGKAFREKGYSIRKNVLDVFRVELPLWLKKEFKTKEDYAKARLSEFYAKKKNTSPIIYGTVVEIYSPDFRNAIINNIDMAQINATTEAFSKVKINMDTIWKKLGDDQGWHSIPQDKILKAKKESLAQIHKYREKIKQSLQN